MPGWTLSGLIVQVLPGSPLLLNVEADPMGVLIPRRTHRNLHIRPKPSRVPAQALAAGHPSRGGRAGPPRRLSRRVRVPVRPARLTRPRSAVLPAPRARGPRPAAALQEPGREPAAQAQAPGRSHLARGPRKSHHGDPDAAVAAPSPARRGHACDRYRDLRRHEGQGPARSTVAGLTSPFSGSERAVALPMRWETWIGAGPAAETEAWLQLAGGRRRARGRHPC